MIPEHIALIQKLKNADFTSEERDLILQALSLGDYRSVKREYPKSFGPGSNRWATAAWRVLDQMRPDALQVRDRFMLAGMIAGALKEFYDDGKRQADRSHKF